MADYFDEEPEYQEQEQEEQEEQEEQQINSVVASAPPPSKEIAPETIEIANKSIIPYLVPQESKFWHFTLNPSNKERLTRILESIPEYRLTVEYGIPQNTPDITLKMNGQIVGKIHLLLCDRRDANLPEKYYCKLYFYQFKNQELYNKVKSTLINFFENFKPMNSSKGGKRSKKHLTKRAKKVIKSHRKKTAKKQ